MEEFIEVEDWAAEGMEKFREGLDRMAIEEEWDEMYRAVKKAIRKKEKT